MFWYVGNNVTFEEVDGVVQLIINQINMHIFILRTSENLLEKNDQGCN